MVETELDVQVAEPAEHELQALPLKYFPDKHVRETDAEEQVAEPLEHEVHEVVPKYPGKQLVTVLASEQVLTPLPVHYAHYKVEGSMK